MKNNNVKAANTISSPVLISPSSLKGVGLLNKTFGILDLFSFERPRWSQADLIKETNISKPTMSRVIRFLCATGYLNQISNTGVYLLGPVAVDLGRRAAENFSLKEFSAPIVNKLAEDTGETVLILELVRGKSKVKSLNQIPSTKTGLKVFESIGSLYPLNAGASAKAVLSILPLDLQEEIINAPLEKITEKTIVDSHKLKADILATQNRGYAISIEETYPGVIGIAAPFKGLNNWPIGSIAIAAPLFRIDDATVARHGELLKQASHELSEKLFGIHSQSAKNEL